MNRFQTAVSALALLAVAATGAGVAYAETTTPNPSAPQVQQTGPVDPAQAPRAHRHFNPVRHIEGRIAYIKAELKITPDQQPLFDKLADALRANAQDKAAKFAELRKDAGKPMTAVDRLQMREKFSELRAQHTERTLAAFKPLYDSLTPDQKKVADEMMSHRSHEHHHHA